MITNSHNKNTTRFIIGCMTGTSTDALDTALVRIDGSGLSIQPKVIASKSFPFPKELKLNLLDAAHQNPLTAAEFTQLSHDLGNFHAQSLTTWLDNINHNPNEINLIAVHGQTLYHHPPHSLQLINPYPIAHSLNTPVIFDLRAADLAAGGQGAPITPIVDALLFADKNKDIVILNLGGFASYTRLNHIDKKESNNWLNKIEAGDICVCNQLLDETCRQLLGMDYDENGNMALYATAQDDPFDELLPILEQQRDSKTSLGSGDECFRWLDKWGRTTGSDCLLRTITFAIAVTIVEIIMEADQVMLAGGGSKNKAILEDIQAAYKKTIGPIENQNNLGITIDNREAAAMAILGTLSQDKIPITLPQITNLKTQQAPIAGSWVFPPHPNHPTQP